MMRVDSEGGGVFWCWRLQTHDTQWKWMNIPTQIWWKWISSFLAGYSIRIGFFFFRACCLLWFKLLLLLFSRRCRRFFVSHWSVWRREMKSFFLQLLLRFLVLLYRLVGCCAAAKKNSRLKLKLRWTFPQFCSVRSLSGLWSGESPMFDKRAHFLSEIKQWKWKFIIFSWFERERISVFYALWKEKRVVHDWRLNVKIKDLIVHAVAVKMQHFAAHDIHLHCLDCARRRKTIQHI